MRYPVTGPAAGVQRTVMVLSFTSVTSISDGDSISTRTQTTSFYHSPALHQITSAHNIVPLFPFLLCFTNCECTCFVCDVDGCAGGGAVSSACHSIYSDGIVSAWTQILNSGSGLRSWDSELFREAVTT